MSGLPLEAGRWAIIDHFSSGSNRILAADGIAAGGISAKRNLGFRGAKLIMPRLEAALAANQDYFGHESLGGHIWAVAINILRAPKTNTPIGALAYFGDPGSLPEPMPLVGAVEWKIDPTSGIIESFWDAVMNQHYGSKTPTELRPAGDMARWANEMIIVKDRARVKMTIDSLISQRDGNRVTFTYGIYSPSHNHGPSTKLLELTGHVVGAQDESQLWGRALVREISDAPGSSGVPETSHSSVNTEAVLEAMLQLSDEHVFIALDLVWTRFFMPSEGWDSSGLAAIGEGDPAQIVHPADLKQMINTGLLAIAAEATIKPNYPIRLLSAEGLWSEFRICAAPLKVSGHSSRYVLCRFDPV